MSMKWRRNFIWEVYFFILCLFIGNKVYNFLHPDGTIYLYHYIFRHFHPTLAIPFILNLLQLVCTIFHLWPLLLFIFRKEVGSVRTWQVLFVIKIILDMSGQSYELSYLRSTYHDSPSTFIFVLIGSISTYVPLYMACFINAFMRKKWIENLARDEARFKAKKEKKAKRRQKKTDSLA